MAFASSPGLANKISARPGRTPFGLFMLLLCLVWYVAACHGAQAQSCSASIPAGAYGNVDVLAGASVNTTGSFTISCTGTKNAIVRLCIDISYGDTLNGAGAVRALANGTNYLVHDIYTDAARSQQWGAWGGNTLLFPFGTGGVQRDLALGTTGAASVLLTMYGKVAANQQTIPPGNYSWSTASPGFTYAYTTVACPTGTLSYRGAVQSDVWTATILKNCLVSAGNVDFGSNGVLAANIDASGSVTVRCTNTTPYSVALSNGSGGGTDPTARRMVNGAQFVTYGLYQDAARTLPFGPTTGTDTVSATGTGLAQAIPVYGRVLPQATPAPGTYTDTITVTVTY